MKIEFGDFGFTECWDGVLYKKLSGYPEITDWEIQNVIDFVCYEKDHGRECELVGDENILAKVRDALADSNRVKVSVPPKITECTACPTFRGCMTDLVCHTSPVENAIRIMQCGSLLSPVLSRKKNASELAREDRNAAKDPPDYFDYIMFAWGNCQAGDRLVMERKLGRFPDERDLSTGFTPGVRFFFRYDRIIRHPKAVFDGVLPLKIRDEVVLADWVHAIVVPLNEKDRLEGCVPESLKDRVHYIENDCSDIWTWSEKVYRYAGAIGFMR